MQHGNQFDGFGIYRYTENGNIYFQQMTERQYKAEAERVTQGAEPLEFIPFVRGKGKHGQPGEVDHKESLKLVEAAKKKHAKSFSQPSTPARAAS